jgi:hypothetical protein
MDNGYSLLLLYRAATTEEIKNSGVTVAALFLENVFAKDQSGESAFGYCCVEVNLISLKFSKWF